MDAEIPDHMIVRLSEWIRSRTGLYFPGDRFGDLKRNISVIAKTFGFDTPLSCLKWLLSTQPQKEHLDTVIRCLTTGETYFYRTPQLFEIIENVIIKDLLDTRSKKIIKCLSAGCCSGEEAYSLAICIDRMTPKYHDWQVTVTGVDINGDYLEKAERGIYSKWSFRNTPVSIVETYFLPIDEKRFRIIDSIRAMTRFIQLNLIENTYPAPENDIHDLDVIMCRNVLMYFDNCMKSDIIDRFVRSLKDGGWVIFSPSDAPHIDHPRLKPIRFPENILYQKI